ncbi:MAG: tocopherol cyclase family protein [Actinomycetota bacterium]
MGVFTTEGTENLMRWDRSSSGFMEVWYSTITHRASGAGVWLRYTLTAPQDADPYCEVWGAVFDPKGGMSFAAKDRFGIDRLGAFGRDDGAIVRIADSWLSENHLEGSVSSRDGMLDWSLGFEPADRCFQHLPQPLRRRAERKVSTLCSPNLSVPFTGTVKVNGRALEFDGDTGCQTHRWGRAHANTWAWSHCSVFDAEDDAVFEAVAAKAPVGLFPGPTLTFLYLSLDGEDIALNELRPALGAKSSYTMPTWAFSAHNEEFKVVGAARTHPARLLQVRYSDPDGSERYCANSEIADLALEVYRRAGTRWLHHRSLTATRTSHLEFGRKEPFDEIPVAY